MHFAFFPFANLCKKKKNPTTHRQESIIAVIQWLSMIPKFVCQGLWGTGLTGFKWGFEVQHYHLWTDLDAAGSWRITSSCWGHWCVFLRCRGTDKEKQGQLCSTQERYTRQFKSACGHYQEKTHQKFAVQTFFFLWRIFHICIVL